MHRSRIGVVLIDHPGSSYAVLTDPGGLVFCVVPVQSPDAFDRHATTWE